MLYLYGGRRTDVWWRQNEADVRRLGNLAVWSLPAEATQALAAAVQRTMDIDITLQEGRLWVSVPGATLEIDPVPLHPVG